MKVLSKAEFLDKDDLPRVPFPLSEKIYGKDTGVFIRTMPGNERWALEKSMFGTSASKEPAKFRETMLIATVVDDKGKPIFAEDDRKALSGKNSGELEKMFTKACRINGFMKEDVEEIAKNS